MAAVATTIAPVPDPYTLKGLGQRLKFARVFIAGIESAKKFAELCDLPPSTYATWEKGARPQELVAMIDKIHAAFPAIDPDFLLRGGVHISSYLTSPLHAA